MGKKKKRAKKRKHKTKHKENNQKQEQQNEISPKKDNTDNLSDDDTITIGSSSNAPSSNQYQDVESNDGDDAGWIIKGTKNNKKNRNTQNRNNNASTPSSSKSN